jgi:alpha-tubulin suppressor-like RCC1 family protein
VTRLAVPRRIALVAVSIATGACTSTGDVLKPVDPVVLHDSEVRLATGGTHTCSVTAGVLSCWGDDRDGQLGVPTGGTGAQAPVTLAGTWLAPAAGTRHTCALAVGGAVACWGANDVGQLGAGDFAPSSAPRPVPLPDEAVELRTAFEFTCAVLADASLWCWGYNWEGQLGQGDQHPGTDRPSPVQVGSDRDWVFVSTGQGHGCGIRAPGTLHCWGRNTDGQLGQGVVQPQQFRSPVQVGADSDWIEVSCSQANTCARKRDRSLWCWGTMASGVLAVGDLNPRLTPARVPVYSDWLSVSSNTFHTCGVRQTGEIWCAGRNTEGQIGSPDLNDAIPNMLLSDPNPGWVEVRAGRFFTCGRKADDGVWCMGENADLQLGVDASVPRSNVMLRAR